MARSRRELTTEDAKIWRHATRSVRPLRGMPRRGLVEEDAPEKVASRAAASASPESAPRTSPQRPQPLPALTLGSTADIDRRTAQRFKRGEIVVGGRIDLHGLTLDQAHNALMAFVRAASARGARCVVVVTGKGKGDAIGKIRRETPHWLGQPPLRALVLAVTEARARDGGAGALYVLLKRKRA